MPKRKYVNGPKILSNILFSFNVQELKALEEASAPWAPKARQTGTDYRDNWIVTRKFINCSRHICKLPIVMPEDGATRSYVLDGVSAVTLDVRVIVAAID